MTFSTKVDDATQAIYELYMDGKITYDEFLVKLENNPALSAKKLIRVVRTFLLLK